MAGRPGTCRTRARQSTQGTRPHRRTAEVRLPGGPECERRRRGSTRRPQGAPPGQRVSGRVLQEDHSGGDEGLGAGRTWQEEAGAVTQARGHAEGGGGCPPPVESNAEPRGFTTLQAPSAGLKGERRKSSDSRHSHTVDSYLLRYSFSC